MKKLLLPALLLTAALTACAAPTEETKPAETAAAPSEPHTRLKDQTYFLDLFNGPEEDGYVFSGTVYQNRQIAGFFRIESLKDTTLSMKGFLNRVEGNSSLSAINPDGTETVICGLSDESEDELSLDLTIPLMAGSTEFFFTGTNNIADFRFVLNSEGPVSYYLYLGYPPEI